MDDLKRDYPWTETPLVSCAPMRLVALSDLVVTVSASGGLGFLGIGSDASNLETELVKVKSLQAESDRLHSVTDVLPVGVGFLLWAGDELLSQALPVLEKFVPAAVWLFAPRHPEQLSQWTREVRRVTHGKTKIWIQVGTVSDAVEATTSCRPDVLVVQGTDAGGHGLEQGASIVVLLPEVGDAISKLCSAEGTTKRPTLVAAGGVMDGRGTAAALALGASGVVMGTRYLASQEAQIAQGYKQAVLEAKDGGVTTARGKLYDTLRGTTDWPEGYGGRGVLNATYHDAAKGMTMDENKRLYEEALKLGDDGWGESGRLTTYAGTGVGLAKSIEGADRITISVRDEAKSVMSRMNRISG